MKRCPTCKSPKRARRVRKAVLKYVPFSRAYTCEECGIRYLYFQPLNVSIKVKKRY